MEAPVTKPNINVTPLIDVLLVLLIIFMVIPQSRPANLDARVPSKPQTNFSVYPNPLTLVVTLKSDSSIWINNEQTGASPAEPDKLIARLGAIFQERTQNMSLTDSYLRGASSDIETAVYVKAPRNRSYGEIARLVDAVKSSGADPVGLQIDDLDY